MPLFCWIAIVDKESEERRLSWSNAIDDFKEVYNEAKEESIVLGTVHIRGVVI